MTVTLHFQCRKPILCYLKREPNEQTSLSTMQTTQSAYVPTLFNRHVTSSREPRMRCKYSPPSSQGYHPSPSARLTSIPQFPHDRKGIRRLCLTFHLATQSAQHPKQSKMESLVVQNIPVSYKPSPSHRPRPQQPQRRPPPHSDP